MLLLLLSSSLFLWFEMVAVMKYVAVSGTSGSFLYAALCRGCSLMRRSLVKDE